MYDPDATMKSAAGEENRLNRASVAGAFQDLLSPANLTILALLAAVALTGLLGGWNKLEERRVAVAQAQVQQVVEAGPFRVKVAKAAWFTDIPLLYPLVRGQRAILVTADVTNISKHFVGTIDMGEAFRIDAPGLLNPLNDKLVSSAKAQPVFVRASDGFRTHALQPGLTQRLALIWLQDEKMPVPAKVKLTVYKQTYRKSSLDGSMQYFDETPAFEIDVPVSEMKAPQ